MSEETLSEPDCETVRALINRAGLQFPTYDQVALLHGHIARRLIAYEGMKNTYRVAHIDGRSIRVKSFYFSDREAVTFNEDGFVGFAGWADKNNVRPILIATIDWIEEITSEGGA